MVFSSTVFLFLFLPVVATAYFAAPRRTRNLLLLAASLFFYAWGENFFVLVLLLSVAINYLMGLWIERAHGTRQAKLALAIAVAVNLEILGLYKYSTFLIDNLNMLLDAVGAVPLMLEGKRLPIGISFFTFQGMSYVIDVYRRDARAQRNPLNVALYVALFPQLIAGPIVRYQHIAAQLAERTVSLDNLAEGIKRFILGLGKKVLLANTLAVPADAIFALPEERLTLPLAWLGIACYTLQIYFDFSGYSDMAIGLGRLFGFHFLENFQWPYVATSMRDFWRRWHISLSTWFRDYLYVPLGGNRHSATRTHFNLVVVFFLCGLWHGAAWTFVVWGLYHGLFLVLERGRLGRWLGATPRALGHGYTLLAVMVGWVIFRADTLSQATTYLGAMAGLGQGLAIAPPVAMYFTPDVAVALLVGIIGATPVLPALRRRLERTADDSSPMFATAVQVFGSVAMYGMILFYCAAFLSAQTYNPFIYFRF